MPELAPVTSTARRAPCWGCGSWASAGKPSRTRARRHRKWRNMAVVGKHLGIGGVTLRAHCSGAPRNLVTSMPSHSDSFAVAHRCVTEHWPGDSSASELPDMNRVVPFRNAAETEAAESIREPVVKVLVRARRGVPVERHLNPGAWRKAIVGQLALDHVRLRQHDVAERQGLPDSQR